MTDYHSRGGKDDPRNKLYNSAAWKRTRRAVLTRDNYACVKCGRAANTVHHIIEVIELIKQGRDPLNPDECESLCAECHGSEDGRRNGSVPVERPKPNRFMNTILSKENKSL